MAWSQINLPLGKRMKKEDNVSNLRKILAENRDKRVVVIGTTCTGKSRLVKEIEEAEDMDELVFPKLSKAESDYVCQKPWTPEIGKKMTELTKQKVLVRPGHPVFGTVVLDADLIVYLKISDELLAERVRSRRKSFEDAKHMQEQIKKEIAAANVPVITVAID